MTVAGFRPVKTVEQLKNPFSILKNITNDGILVPTEKYTGHYSSKPLGNIPNATIDVEGKKGGISRYIYGADMRILYRVDNNDHGNPSEHPFKNGEHYHVAVWEGSRFVKYFHAAEIPKPLHKLCKDILREDK